MTQTPEAMMQREEQPRFKASWIDDLIGWVGQLPGPNWPYYALGFGGVAVLGNAAFWIDGSLAPGSFNLSNTIFGILAFLWLGLYHYLTLVGSRALKRFRPLMAENDSGIAEIEYALSKLPRVQGWLALGIGLAWAVASIVGEPQTYGGLVPNGPLPYVVDLVLTTFLASTFLCLLLRSVRQLRTVDMLQQRAVNIDLLNLEPAHAFSMLTARTGIGLILLLILAYLYDPFKALTALDVFWYGLTVILAAAIFAVPVMSLRGRLIEEKRRALADTTYHLRLAREILHSKVRDKNLTDMKEIDAGLASLARDLELYRRASTWPWDSAAMRALASALVLPIIIWLVTRLLEQIL
jgi:hypothetical protein